MCVCVCREGGEGPFLTGIKKVAHLRIKKKREEEEGERKEGGGGREEEEEEGGKYWCFQTQRH